MSRIIVFVLALMCTMIVFVRRRSPKNGHSNLCFAIFFIALNVPFLSSWALTKDCPIVPTTNPAKFITDADKLSSITKLKDLDNGGQRFYEMNYTADYKLQKALDYGISNEASMLKFVALELYDILPTQMMKTDVRVGCSAYAVTEAGTGNFMMGRNFDFCHSNGKGGENPITAILVRTSPKDGKKSIGMLDSYWLGYPKGFYDDGTTDLSQLIAAPYALMDGINEDGLAIGVLHLDSTATQQNVAGKKTIWTTLAIRLVLDRCSTVSQAIDTLKNYNISMVSSAKGNYHFFIADATGDYAIVEYVFQNNEGAADQLPNNLEAHKGDSYRYVTNFYVSPSLKDTKLGPQGKHGLDRYEKLKTKIEASAHVLTAQEAMQLLSDVSQSANPSQPTSHTQWSSLYNLSERTLSVSILQEFNKVYTFKVQ